jgi:selenocysteine-specific elongation factor
MLAGVGGIDIVLLVIAADEAIKPQTREHFDILQLLGVKSGITVLTKSDAVDMETLEVVRLEVEEFLRGTFLETSKAPLLAVSSLTGAGLENLKRAIVEMAGTFPQRDSQALARLPIDRVFTMKGFGTVVTGTLTAGTVRREDELEVLPSGRRVRVRGIQVHGEAAESAMAGQRTALNVAGASTEDLSRGLTLTPASLLGATRAVDVSLRLLEFAPRPLKNRARVHFHSYTMETVAEVQLLESKQIAPGEQAFARLKFPHAAFILPADRFIIRQFSPVITIGGGQVLDATPLSRKRGQLEFLKTLSSGDSKTILVARIERGGDEGISLSHLVVETGWPREKIEAQLAELAKADVIMRAGELVVHRAVFDELKRRAQSALVDFHKKNPLVRGISKEELRGQLQVAPGIFELLSAALLAERKVEVAGDLVRLPGHGVVMKDEEAESRKKIEDAFVVAGLKVPGLQEVIAGLSIDKMRAQKLVTLLLRDKILVKISDDFVFHRGALEALRQQVKAYKTKSPAIDVAKFKDLIGVSRKYAIPLLEYLDREHVTRRKGDVREIL